METAILTRSIPFTTRVEGIEIEADNANEAAGEILGVVKDTSKANVMYFHGWDGLGASAALRVVAQRLESGSAGPGLKFDKFIHVDCSVWKSRRALQKTIAEELQLPRRVMAIFDQRDEEDDFHGVDEGSRREIPDVTEEIFTNLAGHRFVVVFHNGSGSYIDRQEWGIEFPSLRHIHLHELPLLQRICGRRMSAPSLKIINIRGCWSLSRLPAVGDTEPPPTVDCEKEWWDRLEWDGPQEKHHPSLYQPRHSHYYKTQLPKGSILR